MPVLTIILAGLLFFSMCLIAYSAVGGPTHPPVIDVLFIFVMGFTDLFSVGFRSRGMFHVCGVLFSDEAAA